MKEEIKTVWYLLFTSRKFWIALLAVIQTVLFQFVPDFPQTVWISIDALAAVLIATIAHEDAAESKAYYDAATDYFRSLAVDECLSCEQESGKEEIRK